MPETYELLFTQLRLQYKHALEQEDYKQCGVLLYMVSQFSPEGQEFLAFAELLKPQSNPNGDNTDDQQQTIPFK